MTTFSAAIAMAVICIVPCVMPAAAWAQSTAATSELCGVAEAEAPEVHSDGATQGMGAMDMGMGSPSVADQAHQDLMRGMDAMDAQMMEGMQAQNLDVAFICGMIPHHRGAIDMARAELAHGTDPFARALAEQIIASQQQQIDEMRAWLAKQPK
jgi:uncharacterized protein (DUF305 family)